MEIERKYKIRKMPEDLDKYQRHIITQAYLCHDPILRIRRSDDEYFMTFKGKGLIMREEYDIAMTKEGFEHLLTKADGKVISKTRYVIPIKDPGFRGSYELPEGVELCVELDVFDEPFAPLVIAEVEFPDAECANAYIPEDWFAEEVSSDVRFHNVNLAYYS